MNNPLLISIISMSGMTVLFAVILYAAYHNLKVAVDPRVEKILEELSGANCGACGYAGCRAYAEAAVAANAEVNLCLPGGAQTAARIAQLLGKKAGDVVKKVAVVHCGAEKEERAVRASYDGFQGCAGVNLVMKGNLSCRYGCLGLGDCFGVCPFNAIKMVKGLPHIDSLKCTSCGNCVSACPRNIISVEVIKTSFVKVACSSKDKGPATKKNCKKGCIACRICEKLSNGAFVVEENLSKIKADGIPEGVDWNKCIAKCPTKCIVEG